MDIENSNEYGRLEEKELEKFENKIGGRFPEDFRTFLLRHNGGKPIPSSFKIPDQKGDDSIHRMFGLHSGPEHQKLDKNWITYRRRMPESIVPFGDDPMGNAICIGINGDDSGKTYFWDHENEGDKGSQPFYGNLQKISDTFQAFLDGLFERIDPNETEIERILREDDIKGLEVLLDGGYDIDTTNEYDRTLIEESTIKGNKAMIEVLHERGAELRDSIAIAEQNAEFFEKHKGVVILLKRLYDKE